MAKKKRKPRTPAPPRAATSVRTSAPGRAVQAPQVRKKQRDPAVRERYTRLGMYGLGGLIVIGAVIALVVVLAAGGGGSKKAQLSIPWASLPGVSHGPPPWQAEINNLLPRLQTIGVPELPQEGTVLHIHQHLDIFDNGKHVTVPQGIGINPPPDVFFSELHTHQTDGIIHVESATKRDFSLGEFFAVWGVFLSKKCIGGLCAKPGTPLKFYVGGVQLKTDPDTLVLKEHQEIAIVYGKPPKKIPSTYNFAAHGL